MEWVGNVEDKEEWSRGVFVLGNAFESLGSIMSKLTWKQPHNQRGHRR